MTPFVNPARSRIPRDRREPELYPYYAGFSPGFAMDALAWLSTPADGLLLDPWNGAGTTTSLSTHTNVRSIGFDLNPVMVVVAKANLAVQHESGSIGPLTEKMLKAEISVPLMRPNPLTLYFSPQTAEMIQVVARNIWDHLVSTDEPVGSNSDIDKITPIAATFFVGLFNTIRELLRPFATSNPTWIKTPKNEEDTIHIDRDFFTAQFRRSMNRIENLVSAKEIRIYSPNARCGYSDARNLPLDNLSIDSVLTSPPYCTRLDYARATLPELLILESIKLASHTETRIALMGSSLAKKPDSIDIPAAWGEDCQRLMAQIYEHPSKASKSYYFNTHYRYFEDLYSSITELGRVTKPSAKICVVAQDSYYKEVHNDLPRIIMQMAKSHGMIAQTSFPYAKKNSIKLISNSANQYSSKVHPIETAILLIKD